MRARMRARMLGRACLSFVISSRSVSRALATGFASGALVFAALLLMIVVLFLAADEGLVGVVLADVAAVLACLLHVVDWGPSSSSKSTKAGPPDVDLFQDGLTAARSWKRPDATGGLAIFGLEAAR